MYKVKYNYIANIALKIDNRDKEFVIDLHLQTFGRGWFNLLIIILSKVLMYKMESNNSN